MEMSSTIPNWNEKRNFQFILPDPPSVNGHSMASNGWLVGICGALAISRHDLFAFWACLFLTKSQAFRNQIRYRRYWTDYL
jgi:hypothetical protein